MNTSTPETGTQTQINELLKANEMLRRALARLTVQDNLHSFFQCILLEMTANTGANHTAVFIYQKTSHNLQMVSTVHEGTVRDIQHDPVFVPWRNPIPADITPAWQKLCELRKTVCIDNDNSPPEHWPKSKTWHAEQGHKTILAIPLIIGDEVLGFLRLCFKAAFQPSGTLITECETIAQQAAIAYKLKQLADDARIAAVARERENVANERAQQLFKTFTVLRRTSAKLAQDFELKTFLEHVLVEINDHFQADAAILSIYDEESALFTALAHVENGKLNSKENFCCTRANAEMFLKALTAADGVREFDVESEAHLLLHCSVAYHRKRGHARIFAIPLMLGEQVKGYIGVAIRTRETLVLHQQELLLALAHQASMAIQLTRLADSTQTNAILAERNRMAREIHDTLAQGFTAILVNIKSLRKQARLFPGEISNTLEALQQLAEDNLIEARRSVRGLRPRALGQGSLLDGLRNLVDSVERTGDTNIELLADAQLPVIPEEIEDELIRIAQEALQNALRYAHGTDVTINLQAADEQGIHLMISDNGNGFDQNTTKPGFGLIGMGERAAHIGAAITIISEQGFGTQIIVAWSPGLNNQERR